MTITMPVWLFVSQWVLLFALGFLLFVAYRQIGYLLGLKDIGTDRDGLAVGEQAQAFDFIYANQSVRGTTRFEPKGAWSLLLFADPTCLGCQDAVAAVERLVPKAKKPLRILILTSADPDTIGVSETFRTTSLDICQVSPEVSSKLYRTRVTPFAYLIDPEGRIGAKGVAGDESSIRKIMQGGDRTYLQVGPLITVEGKTGNTHSREEKSHV